jgi:thiamine biosynthesis protein ThiS
MQLVVNGEPRQIDTPGPVNVEQLVQSLGFPRERVAVELNGALVLRGERTGTPVRDGDRLEIVTLVGGG